MIDLIGFKKLNDASGHHKGDEALRAVAKTIVRSVRSQDRAFRLGGDEFLVILEDIDHEAMRAVAARIVENIEAIDEFHLSCRIGGVLWETEKFPNEDLSSVIGAADRLERQLRQSLIDRTGTAKKVDIREYAP